MKPPTKRRTSERPEPRCLMLVRDVIGVIATFLPQTTEQQRSLMLVCDTWYRGVMEQDGMKPKPGMFWPWCALQERHASSISAGFVTDTVCQHLVTAAPNLTDLNLEGNITGDCCVILADYLPQLQRLRSLRISACRRWFNGIVLEDACEVDIITDAVKTLHELRSLTLENFSFNALAFERLSHHLPHLTSLSVQSCQPKCSSTLTDSVLSRVASRLKDLHVLTFHGATITDEGLTNLAKQCQHLTSLSIHHCGYVLEGCFEHLIKLTVLRLRGMNLSHAGLSAIGMLPNLVELALEDGYLIPTQSAQTTASGVSASSSSCWTQTRLKMLSLKSNTCISQTQLISTCTSLVSFLEQNKETLTSVQLRGCDESSLQGGVVWPYKLTALDVSSSAFDDVAMAGIAELKELTSLNVSFCEAVTESGFNELKDAKKLVSFSASSTKITNAALGRIVKGNPHLRTLEIDRCDELSDDALHLISVVLPRLTGLSIHACPNITQEGMMYMATKLHDLIHLEAGGRRFRRRCRCPDADSELP